MGNMPYGSATFEKCYDHFYRLSHENNVHMLPDIIDQACTEAWSIMGERANAGYDARIADFSVRVDDIAMYAIRYHARKYGVDMTGRVRHNWNQWKAETCTWRIGCAHFCRAMTQNNTLPADVLRIVSEKCRGCREALWSFVPPPC